MKPAIRAVIGEPRSNAKNLARDKEIVSAYSLVCAHKGEIREAITVRVYMGRSRNASTVYASVWIRPADASRDWNSGIGNAGGHGYDKESQAIADAISSAGVDLFGDPYCRDGSRNKDRLYFGGTGSSAYEAIFTAIARAAGYRGKCALISH